MHNLIMKELFNQPMKYSKRITLAGADIHKTRYRADVLDFNKRYRSGTGHYHVYERGVPDIVLQHEKCIRHSVKVPGKCPLSGMDISPCYRSDFFHYRKHFSSVDKFEI